MCSLLAPIPVTRYHFKPGRFTKSQESELPQNMVKYEYESLQKVYTETCTMSIPLVLSSDGIDKIMRLQYHTLIHPQHPIKQSPKHIYSKTNINFFPKIPSNHSEFPNYPIYHPFLRYHRLCTAA